MRLIPSLTLSFPVRVFILPMPPSLAGLLMLLGSTFGSAVWRLEMMNFCNLYWIDRILDITSRARSDMTLSGLYLILSVATVVKWR